MDKERDFEETQLYCNDCGEYTTHAKLGLIPTVFASSEPKADHTYTDSAVCTECMAINHIPVTDEDVSDAHSAYLIASVQYGDASKDELEDIVGEDKVPW